MFILKVENTLPLLRELDSLIGGNTAAEVQELLRELQAPVSISMVEIDAETILLEQRF